MNRQINLLEVEKELFIAFKMGYNVELKINNDCCEITNKNLDLKGGKN